MLNHTNVNRHTNTYDFKHKGFNQQLNVRAYQKCAGVEIMFCPPRGMSSPTQNKNHN